MEQISAAENLTIEIHNDRWQLVTVGEDERPLLLLDADAQKPLKYTENFATTRHLPINGVLPLNYVWRVVVGWSHEDEAWHIGLLLSTDLANARGSRWCEIAYWPDPDPTVFRDLARQAGIALADLIHKPFHLVPPQAVKPPKQPLPSLPIEVGLWTLSQPNPGRVELIRSKSWVTKRLMWLLWYVFWMIVYLTLSIGTLTTNLALPNSGTMLPKPELLPYIGLLAAGVLFMMVLNVIRDIRTSVNRYIVDGAARRIMALHNSKEKWGYNVHTLQSVYVTQKVSRGKDVNTVQHSEINLHLNTGEFLNILHFEEDFEDPLRLSTGAPKKKLTDDGEIIDDLWSTASTDEDSITLLENSLDVNHVQAVGLYIADTLDELPCMYDMRVK